MNHLNLVFFVLLTRVVQNHSPIGFSDLYVKKTNQSAGDKVTQTTCHALKSKFFARHFDLSFNGYYGSTQ